ncbi:MAG TPA: DEAD/DEAH box helicase family protein [bacterium]|nr:DEAD/DEAH box helicase family protein [bacterium]
MLLKAYQSEALDWLEKFFKRCAAHKDPRPAYAETTTEWRGLALRYHPLPTMPEVPYVCLRIPTGGGKTLIGGMAIERANRALRYAAHSVTLWLVPSEPIREQTITAMRGTDHILHQAMTSALGDMRVLDIDEALRVKPNTLAGANVVIVATMQAFKRAATDTLNVYKQNSEMMPHFAGLDRKAVGNHSLVDVLRLHRPLIIVDEAHNQGTDIAFDTLARFAPCAVLELTATPDRTRQPSNVLFSVGASTLQAAEMIKMPLTLVRRGNWLEVLRDAVACLNKLQALAQAETAATGDYLRPIMLLQAERSDSGHETIVPEMVKQALQDDCGVAHEEIAIATGKVDELGDEDVLSADSRRRFIITIDKLREGWDCPFAYVLCSFRNTSSGTAAEQILGRIMRMPHARRKQHDELNEAYAFITSPNMQAAVESMRDGLVRNGFERQEAGELIHAVAEAAAGDDLFSIAAEVTFSAPELPETTALPPALQGKVEITPENGTITLKGRFSPKQAETLAAVFQTAEGKQCIATAIEKTAEQPIVFEKTPAERGERLVVPLLAVRQGDLWEPFEETHILQGAWRLTEYSCELTESEFARPDPGAQGGRFSIGDRVTFEYLDDIGMQLALAEHVTEWDQVRLVDWLARNIPDDCTPPDEKAAFLDKAVTWLRDRRGLTLNELNYAKARLRAALEAKIDAARRQAMRQAHQQLLGQPDLFRASADEVLVFDNRRYAYDYAYAGFTALPKHFYHHIGNLQSQGEEFTCALFLATQLPGVNYWVRNVERKPTSFSLQTGTDRFYPDFIVQLQDGRILVVEYKNSRDWVLPDNEEKRRLGELWEKRSNGSCLFIMPRGQDWAAIIAKVEKHD